MLIVDQNILVRRAISNILQKYENFEVCWVADESPKIEEIVKENKPDVVLLSIDNMQSDEFTILSMLRLKFPDLPVLVISPRSEEGAEATINALRMGAVDFITKPEHKNLILFADRHLKKRLEPLIRAAKKINERQQITTETLESFIHPQKSFERISEESETGISAKIVVVGGCTGGLQALFAMISALPSNLQVPIVIVQHLPRMYTKYLASKLDTVSNVNVREVQDGVELDGGQVWVAPGGYQCEVGLSGYTVVLNTHRGLRENNMRPSIDTLFRSAAQVFGKRVLGILLSGCGQDGVAGAEAIRKQEGRVLVQDPRTALAQELPFSVLKKGLSREYYSPEELANEIISRTTQSSDAKVIDEQEGNSIGDTLIF